MECQCNDQNFLAKGTKDNHKRKEEVDILRKGGECRVLGYSDADHICFFCAQRGIVEKLEHGLY